MIQNTLMMTFILIATSLISYCVRKIREENVQNQDS